MITIKALQKFGKIYDKIEEYLLVVMLVCSLTVLFINVILRYIFNLSLYGADEIARICFVWMSWLGISIAERENEHIKIDILTSRLHGLSHKIVTLISTIITLAILACLVKYGMGVVMSYIARGGATPMYHFPNWLLYGSVPYGCAVMAIRRIIYTIKELTAKDDNTKKEGEQE